MTVTQEEKLEKFLKAILSGNDQDLEQLISEVDLTLDDETGISALHYAAEAGNMTALNLILSTSKINVNKATLQSGSTPLMQAAMNGHVEAVKSLLESGADASITSRCGYTALMMAVEGGHSECIDVFLPLKCDLHAVNTNGDSLFTLTIDKPEVLEKILKTGRVDKSAKVPLPARHLDLECARHYIDAGFDVEMRDGDEETPLLSAARHGRVDLAEFFLSKGADIMAINKLDQNFFELAGAFDDSETLLKKYPCPDEFMSQAIKGCCFSNRLELIKNIASEEQIAGAAEEALVFVANSDSLDCLRLFLPHVKDNVYCLFEASHNAVSNNQTNSFYEIFRFVSESSSKTTIDSLVKILPFFYNPAAECGNLEIIDFLLGKGAPVKNWEYQGATPLMIAAAEGHLEVVKRLVEAEVDVNFEHENGSGTALIVAATNGHAAVVKFLLESGANPSITDSTGYTALLSATFYNRIDVVEELLKSHTQNINVTSADGLSPLLAAVKIGDGEVAERFLDLGAELNQRDDEGNTAVHIAALEGHSHLILFLISKMGKEAFFETRNAKGQTPLDILIDMKQYEIISDRLTCLIGEMTKYIEFPSTKDAEPGQMCLICRDDIECEQFVLPCRHGFHTECIFGWIDTNQHHYCPTCKSFPYKKK